MAARTHPARLPELDGLRGIAAAVVFIEHLALAARLPWWLGFTPLGLLMTGFEAVILFFVLSGFVLALPRAVGAPQSHSRFLVRRVLRLCPAFVAAVLLAALLPGVPVASSAILAIASAGLLVFGSHTMTALNSAFWSLIHESRASIVFPLLVRASLSWVGCAVVAIIWLVESLSRARLPGQLSVTLFTLPAFVVGIRLALRPPGAGARLSTRALLVIAVACIYATNMIYVLDGGRTTWRPLTVPVDILAAALFIICARRAPALLLGRAPQYLGRISYSLYLIHLPLFLAVRSHPALLPLAGVAAVGFADLSQRFIEAPAIRLGRKLPSARPDSVPAVAVRLAE